MPFVKCLFFSTKNEWDRQTPNLQFAESGWKEEGVAWNDSLPRREPLSPAPSLSPKPENPSDGHLPSELPRCLLQGSQINTKCVCVHTHKGIFKASSWRLQLSKSTISCQAPDSATLTECQFCARDSVCHVPWPGHEKKPSRGFKWPALLHFTFEIRISFTLTLATCSY